MPGDWTPGTFFKATMHKIKLTLILLVVNLLIAGAQTRESGIWSEIGLEKKIGKFELSVSGEMRNSDFLSKASRYGLGLEGNYNLNKFLKVGLSYQYYNFYDSKYFDYQPRQRYNFFVQGDQKFGRFSISLRERLQRTVKDESDRITESGSYDTYKINPAYTWRNRIKLKYNIANFPVTPAFSVESFYQLNNPDGNKFDQVRYILSLNYKFSKSHRIEVYGLIDREINVTSPVNKNVLGVGYYFSFK